MVFPATGLLGLVDKSSYDVGWAQYYGAGLAYKDAYALQSSTFVLTWHVNDAAGNPLANTAVTLLANKGYGASNATFTIGGLPVLNTTGANDGLQVPRVTDANGNVSFTVTDTTQGPGEASNTPTNAIDPLDAPGLSGGYFGQFGLQIGTTPEKNQTMDIVEVHILGYSSKQQQSITFPALSTMTVGGSDQPLTATSSAGSAYPVSFAASPSIICTIVSGAVHAVSQGSCIITASQNGDAAFGSAFPVSRSITISGPPAINYDANPGALIWAQDFNNAVGTLPTSAIWTPLIGDGYAQLGFSNYGTGEIEQNSATAAKEDGNGNLVITASKSAGVWTSSRIWTQGKVNFQYGQLEARIWFPAGSFNWPAFWMLGSSYAFPNGLGGTVPWPNSGEIDIAEGLAGETVDQSTLHGNNPGTYNAWNGGGGVTAVAPLSMATLTAGFHTFGMLWTPNSISFTLDGYIFVSNVFTGSVVVQTIGTSTTTFNSGGVWPFNNPFFLILDDAIPGSAASLPDGTTASMKVDWIHYYSYQGYGAVTP